MSSQTERGLVGKQAARFAEANTIQVEFNRKVNAWFRSYVIVILDVVLLIILGVIAPHFASARNFFNVLDQNAPLMIVSMGTTFVIIAGGFDLSCGQIVSLAGVFGAYLAKTVEAPVLGVLCGILIGAPAGLANGFLVGWLRMNSFLATLATGLVLGGIALFVTSGYSFDLSGSTPFRFLGSARFGIVPVSVVATALIFVVMSVLLSYTVFGRKVYAVGSNPEAARLSGISVSGVRIVVYAIGGLAAGVGGMILTTRTGVGSVFAEAPTMTLNAIAAVVIGGTSISGGRGAIWRTLSGGILLALTRNAFNLLDVEPYWQEVVSGLIIIVAVLANTAGGSWSFLIRPK
jgi:ribose transport system permease protein